MKKKGKNMLSDEQLQKLWLMYRKMNREQQKELSQYISSIDLATNINPDIIQEAMQELFKKYPELKEILCF